MKEYSRFTKFSKQILMSTSNSFHQFNFRMVSKINLLSFPNNSAYNELKWREPMLRIQLNTIVCNQYLTPIPRCKVNFKGLTTVTVECVIHGTKIRVKNTRNILPAMLSIGVKYSNVQWENYINWNWNWNIFPSIFLSFKTHNCVISIFTASQYIYLSYSIWNGSERIAPHPLFQFAS